MLASVKPLKNSVWADLYFYYLLQLDVICLDFVFLPLSLLDEDEIMLQLKLIYFQSLMTMLDKFRTACEIVV